MMITREQITTATAGAAFIGSAALVAHGATSTPRPGRACMAVRLAFGALALVTITRRIHQRQKDRDTANSHIREGYRLGLTHAAHGLLSPHPDNQGQGATAQDASPHLSAVPAQKSAEGPTKGKPQ
ncbi:MULTISPECIES: hypothetical protein [Streptomyces]|uniref:hypothetical protein n=1 Tax=Streptomyces TaxID=1883 RepID=UPI00131B0FDD|nr:hypothetical protein [Streptomyces sp. CB02120-2]